MSQGTLTYGADADIVDYILGITFEIWEQGQIDLIRRYYAEDTTVVALEGITAGAQALVDGTRETLASFPDRLLLGDAVIWSVEAEASLYSSHRITSPMTNLGPTVFGPATGRAVRITNIADCVVEHGVITREWLLRDNYALVQQLGFDPIAAARVLSDRRDPASCAWLTAETERVLSSERVPMPRAHPEPEGDPEGFAKQVLTALWCEDSGDRLDNWYAPYAVLHRSPVELYSGRDSLVRHYAALKGAFRNTRVVVDHVAAVRREGNQLDVAARWTMAGEQSGPILGVDPTGRPAVILGATHWHIVDGRIASEWTVFDQLSVIAQVLS